MKNINIETKIINSVTKNIKTPLNDISLHTFSDKTKDFVSKVYNSTTEVIDKFLNTKAHQIQTRDKASKIYQYENMILHRTNGRTSYNLEQNIKMLQEFGITPKFVQYFELGENDFLTIMEISDKKLVPYVQVAERVSDSVKQNFINGVKNLYQKKNIVNKEIFANKDALLVTNDGKQIVFADWGEIHLLNPEDKKNMSEFIKNWHI